MTVSLACGEPPKPFVTAVKKFSGVDRIAAPVDFEWIDIEPGNFYVDPRAHLTRLYRQYRKAQKLPLREPGEEVVERDHGNTSSHV